MRLSKEEVQSLALGDRRGFSDFLISFIVRFMASHGARLCTSSFDNLMEFFLRPPLAGLAAPDLELLISEAFVLASALGAPPKPRPPTPSEEPEMLVAAPGRAALEKAQAAAHSETQAESPQTRAEMKDCRATRHPETGLAVVPEAGLAVVQPVGTQLAYVQPAAERPALLPQHRWGPSAENPTWAKLSSVGSSISTSALETSAGASLQSGASSWSLCSGSLASESCGASEVGPRMASEAGEVAGQCQAVAADGGGPAPEGAPRGNGALAGLELP